MCVYTHTNIFKNINFCMFLCTTCVKLFAGSFSQEVN